MLFDVNGELSGLNPYRIWQIFGFAESMASLRLFGVAPLSSSPRRWSWRVWQWLLSQQGKNDVMMTSATKVSLRLSLPFFRSFFLVSSQSTFFLKHQERLPCLSTVAASAFFSHHRSTTAYKNETTSCPKCVATNATITTSKSSYHVRGCLKCRCSHVWLNSFLWVSFMIDIHLVVFQCAHLICDHSYCSIAFKPAESGWGWVNIFRVVVCHKPKSSHTLSCNVFFPLCSAGKKYFNNYDNIFGKKKKEMQENGGETAAMIKS